MSLVSARNRLNTRTIDNLETADPSAETRNLTYCWRYIGKGTCGDNSQLKEKIPRDEIPPERKKNHRKTISISPSKHRKKTKRTASKLPTAGKAERTMDGGPIPGSRLSATPAATKRRRTRISHNNCIQSIFRWKKERSGQKPTETRQIWKSRQLTGQITWASMSTVYKDGPRTKNAKMNAEEPND